MNHIQRFFKELSHPEQKCLRVGHRFRTREVKVILQTDLRGTSMFMWEEWECTLTCCTRCDFEKEPVKTEYIDGITTLRMPDSRWKDLRKKGYTIFRN